MVCVLLSALCFFGLLYHLVFETDSIYSRERSASLERLFFLYSFSKVFELMDTVFMMLRHKGRQVSGTCHWHARFAAVIV